MAKVKIQGHASGTGVFTLTSPNSNTDRTITLPDADVTLGTDATKLPLAGGTLTGNLSIGSVADPTISLLSNASNAASSGRLKFREGDGTNGFDLRLDGSANNFVIDSNNVSNAVTIARTTGKVGIGTSSPDEKLDVEGTIQTSRTDGYTANWKQMISHASSSYNGTLYFTGSTSTGGVIFRPNGSPTVSFPVAGGITFGSDTATANTLDDYEEGTWTATIHGANVSGGTFLGYYTKIGNLVHASLYVQTTFSSVSGTANISGLPYNTANLNHHYGVASYVHGNAATGVQNFYLDYSNNRLYPIATDALNTVSWQAGGKALMLSITYRSA